MNRTLIETADGSLTLFVPALNEHYHSTHGALQEADHVFIQNGVACKNHLDSIRIFRTPRKRFSSKLIDDFLLHLSF